MGAYYAITALGPYVEHQVVVLDERDPEDAGWIRSGYFRELADPQSAQDHILMPVVLDGADQ